MNHPYATRSPVFGRNGMVATSQPLAVAAGLQILERGGNAADAAIATAAALNVTEPTSTGLGGDCFALFYEARTRRVYALNGSGRAPAALTLERLQKEGFGDSLPPFHPYTITVPGACAGWCDLLERHGTLPLSEVLAPAIHLAEEGFPVAPVTAHFWQRAEKQLLQALNGRELLIDGQRAPRPGEIFRNPGLAKTLRRIAEGGKKAFYEGEIAEAIVAAVQQAGGCLSLEDLAEHTSTWDEPISIRYKDYRLWECPPNGQGLTALLALGILEGFELPSDPLSPERLHLEIEALRLAFADARYFIADPRVAEVPLGSLLDPSYLARRRALIAPKRSNPHLPHGIPYPASDTVYLTVVDRWGNACSFINSNYMGFGTGIVPRGWGFTLQNRGHNFNLQPDHPNALAPRKRPYHTIIPALITHADDDCLFASFGVMGGFMQPQGHVQVFLALIENRMDPQEALDLPRFCLEEGTAGSRVALESGIPPSTLQTLREWGHEVRPVEGWERALFGRGQVILRERQSGVLIGGSDRRADGCAMAIL